MNQLTPEILHSRLAAFEEGKSFNDLVEALRISTSALEEVASSRSKRGDFALANPARASAVANSVQPIIDSFKLQRRDLLTNNLVELLKRIQGRLLASDEIFKSPTLERDVTKDIRLARDWIDRAEASRPEGTQSTSAES